MQREVDGVGELGVEQAAPAGGLADLPVVHGHAVEGAHSSIWNSHQPYCTLPRCNRLFGSPYCSVCIRNEYGSLLLQSARAFHQTE